MMAGFVKLQKRLFGFDNSTIDMDETFPGRAIVKSCVRGLTRRPV